MTLARADLPTADWLSIREASQLVGVSVATLRRWSDAGNVSAFTTPGGHRRFDRSVLLGLAGTPHMGAQLDCADAKRTRMLRAYRHELRRTELESEAVRLLPDRARRQLRQLGTRVVTDLLTALESRGAASDRALLRARKGTAACALIAAQHRVQLADALGLFIRFRGTFLRQLGFVASSQGRSTLDTAALLVAASDALDNVLPGILDTYG